MREGIQPAAHFFQADSAAHGIQYFKEKPRFVFMPAADTA